MGTAFAARSTQLAQTPTESTETTSQATAWRRSLIGLFLLVSATSMLFAGGHSYAIDNEVMHQTTRSLFQLQPHLDHADPNFSDEFGAYRVRDDGEWVAIVGVGQSLVSAPLYVVSELTGLAVPADVRDQYVRLGTFFTNSFVLGAIAALVAMLAKEFGATPRRSVALGFIFAFGTYAFPYGGMFFTELSCAALLCLASLLTFRGWREPSLRFAAFAGLALGFGFLVRPSMGLFFPIFGFGNLIVVAHRRGLRESFRSGAAMAAGALPMGVAFAAFAWWRFGSPIDLGYPAVYQNLPFVEGMSKQLVSPGKSFFVFAPITFFAFAGTARGWKTHRAETLLVLSIVVVNFAFYARVPFWAGDNSWGPRYAVIVLPLAVVLVAPLLNDRARLKPIAVAAVLGFAGPVLAGSLISMNTLYHYSFFETRPGDNWNIIHRDPNWQQIWRNWLMVPEAIEDVVTGDVDSTYQREEWDPNPDKHYEYYAAQPRIDFWWLWVPATGGHWLSYLWFGPIAAAFWGARRLLPSGWRNLAGPVGDSVRQPSSP